MSAAVPDPDTWLSQWVADSLAYLIGECGTPPWHDAASNDSKTTTTDPATRHNQGDTQS